jgi:hypothetical protein
MPENIHLIVIEVLVGGVVLGMIRGYFWLKDLWDWHALADEEGVKVWYVRKSLGDAIDKIASVMVRIDRREEQREQILVGLTAAVERLAEKIEG